MATEVVAPEPSAFHAAQHGQQSSRFVTNDAAVSRNRFRVLTLIAVVVSIFFQTIALVSPGWNILMSSFKFQDETTITKTVYESVYYVTTCVETDENTDCKVTSRLTGYRDTLSDTKSDTNKARLGLNYNRLVHTQIDVQLAWIFTLLMVFFHVFKILKGKEYPRASVLAVVVLAITCMMMYAKLFDAFIEIDFTRKYVEATKSEEDSVGFPYSVFFYCFGLTMCVISCCLCCKSVFDYIKECSMKHETEEVRKDRERRLKEWYEEELNKRIHNHTFRPNPSPRPSPYGRYDYDHPYNDGRERHSGFDERDSRRSEDVHLKVPPSGGSTSGNDHGGNHFNFDVRKPSPRGTPRGSPRGSPRNSREVKDRDSHSPRVHHHGGHQQHHHHHHTRDERAGHSPTPRNGHHHGDRRSDRPPREHHGEQHRSGHRERHEATHREHPAHADRDRHEPTSRRRSPPRDERSSSSEGSKQEYELLPTHSDVDGRDSERFGVNSDEATVTSNVDTTAVDATDGGSNDILTVV